MNHDDVGRGASVVARYEQMVDALLDAYRTGTPEALERHYRLTWHRRAWPALRTYVQLDLGKRPSVGGDDVDITREDARYLIAREYGFSNWDELRAFAASPAAAGAFSKPVRVARRQGPDEWSAGGSARHAEEVVRLLALDRSAGLRAGGQLTDATLAVLVPRLEWLTALDLSGCRGVTDAGLAHLGRLPLLRHLDLGGTGVTDAGLAVLRQLPHLETISLAWTEVTDAGVAALAHCAQLERVDLSGTGAGDRSLRVLAGKPRIRHLCLNLTDAGIPLLHELPVFRTWQDGEARLSLLGPQVTPNHLSLRGSFGDVGLQRLRGLDGLFSLDIDDSRLAITSVGISALIDLPRLGVLALDAKDDWMPRVAAIPRLRFLSAQDTAAGDEGFAALSRSRTIEYIWGRRCHNLRRRGFLALAEMPALRGLSVSCLNVDEAGIAALPAFPALRELMPMDVPDAGYRHIGRCEGLESLLLMYCRDTTDAATGHIAGLPRLSRYFNSYTAITDRTPSLLSSMDSLERVTFDSCHGLTNAGVARLARLPRLRELRVSGRGLTADVGAAFPEGVTVSFAP